MGFHASYPWFPDTRRIFFIQDWSYNAVLIASYLNWHGLLMPIFNPDIFIRVQIIVPFRVPVLVEAGKDGTCVG